jgi:hypothetical protein
MPSRRVSTAEIVARRALERSCGSECVDWAVSMLAEGFDSPHIRILAGKHGPHNHFELASLRDRALDELEVGVVSPHEAVRVFAKETLEAAIKGDADLRAAIETVSQLYIESDYPGDLLDFYLLRNAYRDLQTFGDQFYWPNADRSNILDIMKTCAEAFVRAQAGQNHG